MTCLELWRHPGTLRKSDAGEFQTPFSTACLNGMSSNSLTEQASPLVPGLLPWNTLPEGSASRSDLRQVRLLLSDHGATVVPFFLGQITRRRVFVVQQFGIGSCVPAPCKDFLQIKQDIFVVTGQRK